jgi:hypothetical protein
MKTGSCVRAYFFFFFITIILLIWHCGCIEPSLHKTVTVSRLMEFHAFTSMVTAFGKDIFLAIFKRMQPLPQSQCKAHMELLF